MIIIVSAFRDTDTALTNSRNSTGCPKTDRFLKCMTPVYDDVGRRSIYQYIQLFIRSKTGILNVAIFKYSLHKFSLEKRYYTENTN